METKTMLEKLADGIERVAKAHGTKAAPPMRKMGPGELVAHALEEIQKAAKEPAERAKERLAALRRAVDTAKQAFVDTESEQVEVQVFEESTTAAQDESEKELSPVALEAAIGNAAFASNPEDLHKALEKLAKDIAGLREGEAPRKASKESDGNDAEVAKSDADWPSDMNTKAFRDGIKKAGEEPTWGYDPRGGDTNTQRQG